MVREGTINDISWAVDFLWETEKKGLDRWSGVTTHTPNLAHLAHYLGLIVGNSNVCFFYTENCVLIGHVQPSHVNYAIMVATDIVFRSNGQDGPKVLRRFEQWAEDMKADEIRIYATHMMSEKPESQARYFTRKGYLPIETVWKKAL